jgi:hypothetical protein
VSNRAIDRHEDAIVRVMDLVDAGSSYCSARDRVAMDYAQGELSPGRLDHLVRCWCAVGGFPFPGRGAVMIPNTRIVGHREDGSLVYIAPSPLCHSWAVISGDSQVTFDDEQAAEDYARTLVVRS